MSQLTLEHAYFLAAVYTFSSKTHIQAMDLEKTPICLSQKFKSFFFFFYFLFLRIIIFLKQRGSEVIKNTLYQIIFSSLAFHQVVLLGTNLLRLIRVFATRSREVQQGGFYGKRKCQLTTGSWRKTWHYLLSMVEHSKEEHGHQQQ